MAHSLDSNPPLATPKSSAVRALAREFKLLNEKPVEGFRVKLVNEDNLFLWEVAIFGPPNTLYEGGYFKAHMEFPYDYPSTPPIFRFLSNVWHPNVYPDGELCISILHKPTDRAHSDELPGERWTPTQTVRTVLLSVISLLNDPNPHSPANIYASHMYCQWKDSNGRVDIYESKQVLKTRANAKKDGIVVPLTVEEYCIPSKRKKKLMMGTRKIMTIMMTKKSKMIRPMRTPAAKRRRHTRFKFKFKFIETLKFLHFVL